MNKSMKRYNIHMPADWIPQITLLRDTVQKRKDNTWTYRTLSVADMIRMAIASFLNLHTPQPHFYDQELPQETKTALRILARDKKWPK